MIRPVDGLCEYCTVVSGYHIVSRCRIKVSQSVLAALHVKNCLPRTSVDHSANIQRNRDFGPCLRFIMVKREPMECLFVKPFARDGNVRFSVEFSTGISVCRI